MHRVSPDSVRMQENMEKIRTRVTPNICSAYICGFKHKFTIFLQTTPEIVDHLFPIEEILKFRFIPGIRGGHNMFSYEKIVTCTCSEIQ